MSYLNMPYKRRAHINLRSVFWGSFYLCVFSLFFYVTPWVLETGLPATNLIEYKNYGHASGLVMLAIFLFVIVFVINYSSRTLIFAATNIFILLTAPAYVWAIRGWLSKEGTGAAKFISEFIDFKIHKYFYDKMSIIYFWLLVGLGFLFAIEHAAKFSNPQSVNIGLSFGMCAVSSIAMIILSRISKLHDILWFGSNRLLGHEALLRRHNHVAVKNASELEGHEMTVPLYNKADEISELEIMLEDAIRRNDIVEQKSIVILINQIKKPFCEKDFSARLERAEVDRYL